MAYKKIETQTLKCRNDVKNTRLSGGLKSIDLAGSDGSGPLWFSTADSGEREMIINKKYFAYVTCITFVVLLH